MKAPLVTMIAQKKLDLESTKKRKADTNATKKKATKKNSLAPKRPASAFFVFMEEFRKSYKENFPDNKSVAAVSKAGGEKWKSMCESEKSPYVAKAVLKKAEYTKAMEEFNKTSSKSGNVSSNSKAEESEKSSSEFHDEDEASS